MVHHLLLIVFTLLTTCSFIAAGASLGDYRKQHFWYFVVFGAVSIAVLVYIAKQGIAL